jgi:anaerobic magnesium-protoporphyrin IX monomethyl ester cyclase
MSLVPPVFGLFARLLKDRGFVVDLFDSTGYDFEGRADASVEDEKNLFNKPVEAASPKGIRKKLTNMFDDFVQKVETFSPDLIAMSVTESTFLRGVAILRHLRSVEKQRVLTIVGGVFATFAPERLMREPEIDILCLGEGDVALPELCEKLQRGEDFSRLANLWVKRSDGTIVKNAPGKAVNINELPPIDFSIFEDDRFYRPMRGSVYRMLPVETHRGCPYTCTFCNSPAQNVLYDNTTQSQFFRKKSPAKIREELLNFRDVWKGGYVFFWADTFLAWSLRELEEFCEMYEEFKIPFWCQTRPETVTPEAHGHQKLEMLRKVGLHHMSFGMEHGNEKFRADVIDRAYTNESAIRAMQVPVEVGVPYTVNNIIGFPDETRDLAMDTVEINRQFKSFNLSCSTFAPYCGTVLRNRAVSKGYLEAETIAPSNSVWSVLTMPQFPRDEIYGLQRTFVMYVKFPKSRWPEIRQAESLTPEGDAIWGRLRDEFLATYFQDPEPRIEKVNEKT